MNRGAWNLLFGLVAAIAALNCVGDSSVMGDAGPDASEDTGDEAPAPGTVGGPCFGNGTCDKGLTCASNLCVDLGGDAGSDATEAGFAYACHQPSDCTSTACCATLETSGNIPLCTPTSGSSVCTSTCATMLPTTVCSVATVRLCKTSSDCPESSFNECCMISFSTGTISLCATSAFATAYAGSCMAPVPDEGGTDGPAD